MNGGTKSRNVSSKQTLMFFVIQKNMSDILLQQEHESES